MSFRAEPQRNQCDDIFEQNANLCSATQGGASRCGSGAGPRGAGLRAARCRQDAPAGTSGPQRVKSAPQPARKAQMDGARGRPGGDGSASVRSDNK